MLSGTVIIGIINLLLIILVGAFNWFSHNKIVGNDLHHLSIDVKKISDKQETIEGKVVSLAEDLAFVKGNCASMVCKARKNKK